MARCSRALGQPAEDGGDVAWVTEDSDIVWLKQGVPPWHAELIQIADGEADPAQFQQPLTPQIEAGQPPPLPIAAQRSIAQLFGAWGVPPSAAQGAALTDAGSADTVLGAEATIRVTTDAGSLLGSSPQILNLGVQRRNPIVTDPRVRGSRVGSLAASGSYWIPARIDLDTVVSKLDSRDINSMTVIPGPYSALYGPGYQFIDVDLLRAPLFADGFEAHGESIVDFRSNGEQWHGRQNFWTGDRNWGLRGGAGVRTGNDYVTGDGQKIPSSYKSRDENIGVTGALTEATTIGGNYLRLDQTDVELPGQAFDIDFLYTDAYEAEFVSEDMAWCDRLKLETWYNRTVLEGSAQRPSKRATFPIFDAMNLNLVGFTDVDALSTGYEAAATWSDEEGFLTAGADLRFIKQELNENISSIRALDVRSIIPDSDQTNPGLFVETGDALTDVSRFRVGMRLDYFASNVVAPPAALEMLGPFNNSAAAILGSDQFEQDKLLGLTYATIDHDLSDVVQVGADIGYGERGPNPTEYYAVEPFMFLIQNGLNTVTGDPTLDKERVLQTDLRAAVVDEDVRMRIAANYAWAFDYITFENIGVLTDNNLPLQTNLKYVNTELATLWGFEGLLEVDLTSLATLFGTSQYIEGEDRTRNGDFATDPATGSMDQSVRVPGEPRGAFADDLDNFAVPLPAQEPLPSILPLESRLGLRLGNLTADQGWGLELSGRIVDNQDRVAASLLETPTPGFTTYDLRGFWKPRSSLTLVAGIENFTDKNYREHLDFRSPTGGLTVLQPGISFYAGGDLTY